MLVSQYVGKTHISIHESPFDDEKRSVSIRAPFDEHNNVRCLFYFNTIKIGSNKLFFHKGEDAVFELEFGVRSEMLKFIKELKGLLWVYKK